MSSQMATRAAIVGALLVVALAGWFIADRRDWYPRLSKRFIYGVPWGSVVVIGLVLAFYLFAQSGWRHWSDPVTYAFVSWSYFYPMGMLTSGLAHNGPQHLLSNLTGTVVLAPIAEYVWGHYPRERDGHGWPTDLAPTVPPTDRSWVERPWVRAFVIFPAVVLAVSLLTSVFALGWSLGFSGTVFAFAGFAILTLPLVTIVGLVVMGGLGVVIATLSQPVLRATVEAGPPEPPAWAVVNVQAHLLGFLLGALLAIWVLHRREERPRIEHVLFAALLFALAHQLWAFSLPAGTDEFVQYRGVGLVFVLLLALLLAATVAASDRPLPRPLSRFDGAPSRRTIALGWLAILGVFALVGIAGAIVGDEPNVPTAAGVLVIAFVLSLPAIPPLVPERYHTDPLTRKQVAVLVLVGLTLVVALPSAVSNLPVLGPDPVPGEGEVTVEDYVVTYDDNATDPRMSGFPTIPLDDWGNASGVIVVSEDRQLWIAAVGSDQLAHSPNATVAVGGVAWREEVAVTRTGWDVLGNDSAYAVDLETDSDSTRSFTSERQWSDARLDDHTLAVEPTADGFEVVVDRDGERLATGAVPAVNETGEAGPVILETVEEDDEMVLYAQVVDSRVPLATKE